MNQYRTATIPIFTIGEMKRMAKKQLKGKWLRLLPPMLIYTILTTVPAAVIQIYSYLTQSAQIDKILESGNSATSTTDMISDVLISSQASQTGSLTILGTIASFLTLYLFLVSGPFSISFAELSLRVLRNESFSASTVFSGFRQFGKGLVAYILVSVFSILWALLFIFPGSVFLGIATVSGSFMLTFLSLLVFFTLLIALVIFLMRYGLTFFIAADEDTTGSQCVSRSVQLMKGNIYNYFLLQLSFLPWIILLCIPAGVAASTAYTAASAQGGGSVLIPVIFTVVCGIITFAGSMFLMLYMQTASAVFYSGATGNFRSSDETESVEYRISDGNEMTGDRALRTPEDTASDREPVEDETLSMLENDDSLDHLYDEHEEKK